MFQSTAQKRILEQKATRTHKQISDRLTRLTFGLCWGCVCVLSDVLELQSNMMTAPFCWCLSTAMISLVLISSSASYTYVNMFSCLWVRRCTSGRERQAVIKGATPVIQFGPSLILYCGFIAAWFTLLPSCPAAPVLASLTYSSS